MNILYVCVCVCVCVCVWNLFKKQPSFVIFSKQGLGFDPSAVYVMFCGGQSDKGTGFSAECFGFRLSASFHHCHRFFFNFHIHAVLIRKTGEGGGATAVNIRIKQLSQCSHPARQRPTTATNHIQQNQNNTPNAVTGPLFS